MTRSGEVPASDRVNGTAAPLIIAAGSEVIEAAGGVKAAARRSLPLVEQQERVFAHAQGQAVCRRPSRLAAAAIDADHLHGVHACQRQAHVHAALVGPEHLQALPVAVAEEIGVDPPDSLAAPPDKPECIAAR